MGMVFQSFNLFDHLTILDNICLAPMKLLKKSREEAEKRAHELLELVGLDDKADKLPHELSGGEQQRIAIARAILNKPKIIIADEPTGNLDPETAENIIRMLKEISQTGTAVVMSTHNIPLLDKYPGIVYRCCDGKLEEITDDYNKISMNFDDSTDNKDN